MAKPATKKYDLLLKEGNAGYDMLIKCSQPVGMKGLQIQERQIGHGGSTGSGGSSNVTLTEKQKNALAAKKKTKAMAIATKPGQQIIMNAFMLYMSGKTLNIFSISVCSMAILSPLTGLLTVNKSFSSFAGDSDVDLQLPKLIFAALNAVWLIIGLYKMSSMRLLPTTSADWTGSIVWKEMMETTSIPPE